MECSSLLRSADALGGAAPNPTSLAGGERAVQRATVKASRPVFSAGDQPPAAGPLPATALISQTESDHDPQASDVPADRGGP